ncbi:hypothetical protein CYY_001292 [Polysphondylium violaceum]|uniref:Histone acetyltransferase type B catalytic subunit n=1 Tax=Polysphondylium violaceum TaxID=133409 RepID=A0A8J4V4E3_9MYCE|nr:hypothetical protein CYY_001292 [Polysphondylium violaceum]
MIVNISFNIFDMNDTDDKQTNNKVLTFNANKCTNIQLTWTRQDIIDPPPNIPETNENKETDDSDDEEEDEEQEHLDNGFFKPTYSHQIFKEDNIIGYDPLVLNIYMAAGSLTTYLETNYTLKSKNITNVEKELLNVFSKTDAPIPTKDQYIQYIEEKEAKFRPPGTKIHEYSINDRETGEETNYEVYFGRITDPGIVRYHEKLQVFVLWFIDGSSFIYTGDSNWDIFFIFKTVMIDGEKRYGIVGYCTLYNFYHHPSATRPRISQILILPPYQRNGHGKYLLNSIYNYYKNNDSIYGPVYDITVEDPADQFDSLRNHVDLLNIKQSGLFNDVKMDISTLGNSELFENIRKQLLIPIKQGKICFEIFLYSKFIGQSKSHPDYKNFRIHIKKRLYKQFIGDQKDIPDANVGANGEQQQLDPETIEKNKLNAIIELYKNVEEDYFETISSLQR